MAYWHKSFAEHCWRVLISSSFRNEKIINLKHVVLTQNLREQHEHKISTVSGFLCYAARPRRGTEADT
jgi:hypothetical protein